jgi:Fe-S-cluster containining protein
MKDLKEKKKEELSSQEKMILDIFKKNKFLKEEDEINFNCNACGRCCNNQDILLSTLDILRLRRQFEAPTVSFLSEYMAIYPGDNSKMPVCVLKYIKIPDEFNKDLSICPFLKPVFFKELEKIDIKNKTKEEVKEAYQKAIDENVKKGNTSDICTIQENKPEICRLYPLGRGFSKDKKTGKVDLKLFMLDREKLPCPDSCFGCENKRTVKDFLEKNNLGMFIKLQEKYNENIMNLGEISSEGKLTTVEFNMVLAILYNFDAILFFQKTEDLLKSLSEKEGYKKEELKSIIETYKDIPKIDGKLLNSVMKKTATEQEIYNAYENLVEIQGIVINKLVKKYAGNGNKQNKKMSK